MNKLAGKITEGRWPGDGIVPATNCPSIVDQKVYIPRFLGNLGHHRIQGLLVSHVRDDRENVPVDLQELASNSYFLFTSRALNKKTYRILLSCILQDFLASAQDIDLRAIVFKCSSDHQPDTRSTAGNDRNKARD